MYNYAPYHIVSQSACTVAVCTFYSMFYFDCPSFPCVVMMWSSSLFSPKFGIILMLHRYLVVSLPSGVCILPSCAAFLCITTVFLTIEFLLTSLDILSDCLTLYGPQNNFKTWTFHLRAVCIPMSPEFQSLYLASAAFQGQRQTCYLLTHSRS